MTSFPTIPEDDVAAVARLHAAARDLQEELARVIVGQEEVIEQLLIALFAGGHCLLVGVPGLAKTLLIRTLAGSLSLDFNRIQFTPDLMPSDITGTEIIQDDRATGSRSLRFVPGPVFANVVLADEINRTPPKTQAALLEAMQERQVTAGGKKHPLPEPFFVLATQNPIEQEGTYPLPEAQLDRFMFHVSVGYPSADEELEIVLRTTADESPAVQPRLSAAEILAFTHLVRRVPITEDAARDAVDLARRSRPQEADAAPFVKDYVQWGAGPRAGQFMVLGAKARAALAGRWTATVDDVRAVARASLRHRIKTNFNADAERISADEIARRLVESSPPAREDNGRGTIPLFRSPHTGATRGA